ISCRGIDHHACRCSVCSTGCSRPVNSRCSCCAEWTTCVINSRYWQSFDRDAGCCCITTCSFAEVIRDSISFMCTCYQINIACRCIDHHACRCSVCSTGCSGLGNSSCACCAVSTTCVIDGCGWERCYRYRCGCCIATGAITESVCYSICTCCAG